MKFIESFEVARSRTGKYHIVVAGTCVSNCNYRGNRRRPSVRPATMAEVAAASPGSFCRKCFAPATINRAKAVAEGRLTIE